MYESQTRGEHMSCVRSFRMMHAGVKTERRRGIRKEREDKGHKSSNKCGDANANANANDALYSIRLASISM